MLSKQSKFQQILKVFFKGSLVFIGRPNIAKKSKDAPKKFPGIMSKHLYLNVFWKSECQKFSGTRASNILVKQLWMSQNFAVIYMLKIFKMPFASAHYFQRIFMKHCNRQPDSRLIFGSGSARSFKWTGILSSTSKSLSKKIWLRISAAIDCNNFGGKVGCQTTCFELTKYQKSWMQLHC